jgi:hypothetical protein
MNTTEAGAGDNLFLIQEAVGTNARGTSSQGVLDQITRFGEKLIFSAICVHLKQEDSSFVLNDGFLYFT